MNNFIASSRTLANGPVRTCLTHRRPRRQFIRLAVCFRGSFIVVCAFFTVLTCGLILHQAGKDVVRPLLTVRALWLARGVVVVVAEPPLRAFLTLRRPRLFADGAIHGSIAAFLFGYE